MLNLRSRSLEPVQQREHAICICSIQQVSILMLHIEGEDSFRLICIMEQDKLIEDGDVAEIRLQLSISGWPAR